MTRNKQFCLLVITVYLLASCNPVKKILKDESKITQVVEQYVKTHPPKNDTTFHVGLPQVVRDSIIRDTIHLPVPIKERYETIHYRDNVRVDTVKIMDRTLLSALDKRVQDLEKRVEVITEERNYYKKQYRLYLSIVIGIGVLALVILGIRVYSFFTIKKLL